MSRHRLSFIFPIFLVLFVSQVGCAYRFGYAERDLPGGFKQVAVPVFTNDTEIVGIEGAFTNALIRQFNRSQVAQVVSKSTAPAIIEGKILSVEVKHESQINANSPEENVISLPRNSVLTSEYRLYVTADIQLVRASDKKVIWSGRFDNERVYSAPQLGFQVVNSSNALYNHSARVEVIETLAQDMMIDAHDRMTENF